MARRHATLALVAGALLGLSGTVPAQAGVSGTYVIRGPQSGFGSATALAFNGAQCNAAFTNPLNPANGLDAVVIPVAPGEAGRTVNVGWTGRSVNGGLLAQGLRANFEDGGCKPVGSTASSQSPFPQWRFTVPGGASFLVIDSTGWADVSLTVSLV